MTAERGEAHPLRCETCNKNRTDSCPLDQSKNGQRWIRGANWMEEISHYTGCASHSAAKSGAVLDELEKKMIEDIYLMHFTSRREGIEAVPVYAAINIVRQRIGEIK